MEFCHISPSRFLHELNARYGCFKDNAAHLLLAHLVEEDKIYNSFYAPETTPTDSGFNFRLIDFNGDEVGYERQMMQDPITRRYRQVRTDFCPLERANYQRKSTIILDNSAFEMYQRGLPMFEGDKLIELGERVKADYIVMPDYPGENQWKTIAAATDYGPQFKEAGFGTFFVPQSEIGDVDGYLEAFAFAATSPLVDYIGVSILGVPNAFGVYGNPLQQYLSRKLMMGALYDRGLLQVAKRMGKKIHFLGMLDGPNEIIEVAPFGKFIDTWDSSAAVWAGINGIAFDKSPTGLVDGKIKSHVDFDLAYKEDIERDNLIVSNMKYIDDLVEGLNKQLEDSQ